MKLIENFSGSLETNWFLALFIIFGLVGHAAVAQTPGTLKSTGDMSTGRTNHTATLLRDGRVLIAAGTPSSPASNTNVAELYDPSTGMFTATGTMTTARR